MPNNKIKTEELDMEKKEIKHTPTPWKQAGFSISAKGGHIAKVLPVYMDKKTREANAEFIVRAVNAHAELVGALRVVTNRLIYLEGAIKNSAVIENIEEIELAEKAIAKAEGEA